MNATKSGHTDTMTDVRHQKALLGQTARRWMLMPLTLSVCACYATLFEGTTESPIFQSVIDLAPAWAWGIAWAIIAGLSLLTLRFGTAWSYQTTNILMLFMSLTWGGSVIIAKFVDEIPVTFAALGLWGFVGNASIFVVLAPYHVATPPPERSTNEDE